MFLTAAGSLRRVITERAHKFSWFSMATRSRDPQMPQTDVCVMCEQPSGVKATLAAERATVVGRSHSGSMFSQPFYFEFEILLNLLMPNICYRSKRHSSKLF